MDRTTGKVEVTAHNHGFAVDAPARRRGSRRPRTAPARRVASARLPQRRRGRGAGVPRPAGVLGAVPPGGGGRPARRRLPVRPVRRPDDRSDRADRKGAPDAPPHDISSVLVIGSGPIVIGQACEFDYSGTQACRVLREEGIRVILVNSNPATIMTDPEFADATYVEPITPEVVEAIIAKERPDAVLADPGRPDRPQRGDRVARERGPGEVRLPAHRRQRRGDPARRGPREVQGRRRALRRRVARSRHRPHDRRGARRRRASSATRSSCGRRSPWAASAPASPTTRPTCAGWPAQGLKTRRPPRCSSRSRSSAGRSTSSRSCATTPTTSWSSARSRTSTRWACTPATRSPWRRP